MSKQMSIIKTHDVTLYGIIGIDESIAGTCHFGFGKGSGNDAPIHLDVVVNDFIGV